MEHYILEKRHCTLCFWQLEPRKFKLLIKDNGRGDAYGCVYQMRSRSVLRANLMPSHTFGCIVYIQSEGIESVRSIKRAFLGPKQRNGQQEIPSFFSAL